MRRQRCLEVRCGHGACGRAVAAVVRLSDRQRLAIELWRVDGHLEGAIGLDRCGAQYCAASAGHGHLRTRLAAAAQAAAVASQDQTGGAIGCLGIRCRHVDCRRQVAGRVALLHGQCLAVGLRRVEGDFESATRADHRATQHAAIRPAHGHGGARFAVAGDRGTGAVDGRVGDHLRWGGVGCSEVHGPCAVAQVVGRFDGQAFAIALWRVEGDVETAVAAHGGSAQHIAVGVTHGDDGAALTLAGKVDASGIDGQPGGLQRAVGIGRDDVGGRGVASGVAQDHVQFLAVGLRWVQDHADHTVGTDLGVAQHSAVGADDLHGVARFAATGEQAAIGTQLQFTGFIGRGDIGRGDLGRQRTVASFVDRDDIQCFPVGLCRGQADGEAAIRAGLGAA
ncbi:hypothetical protein D3C79_406630 [compost metagenome]